MTTCMCFLILTFRAHAMPPRQTPLVLNCAHPSWYAISLIDRSIDMLISALDRPLVIACYDALLTFGREVDCIWKGKPSIVTVIYVIERYLAIILTVNRLFNPQTVAVRSFSLFLDQILLTAPILSDVRSFILKLFIDSGLISALRCKGWTIFGLVLEILVLTGSARELAYSSPTMCPRHSCRPSILHSPRLGDLRTIECPYCLNFWLQHVHRWHQYRKQSSLFDYAYLSWFSSITTPDQCFMLW